MKPLILAVLIAALPVILRAQHESHEHSPAGSELGLGRAPIETSLLPLVSADFDRPWLYCTIFGTRAPSNAAIRLLGRIPTVPWRMPTKTLVRRPNRRATTITASHDSRLGEISG